MVYSNTLTLLTPTDGNEKEVVVLLPRLEVYVEEKLSIPVMNPTILGLCQR